MAKDIINSYDFDITCKTCNSDNVYAKVEDGYIYLVCERCNRLKDLKEKDDEIAKKLLLESTEETIVEVFKGVLDDSKEVLEVLKQIKYYLDENCKLFGRDSSHLHDGFLFKQELFELSKKLQEITIIDGFYTFEDKLINIGFTTFKELVPNEYYQGKEGSYDLNSRYIAFDVYSTDKLNIRISEEDYIEIDTIFVQGEIDGHISVLEKNIKMIKDYISTKE